jgi:DNA repair exonuclease SbcCD nuclease subunit
MNIFCFGDIHIGSSKYQFVKEQEDKLIEWALNNVRENDCNRIVILGDLFKNKVHEPWDKDKVWWILRSLSEKVDTVVLAGNHDYYDKRCRDSGIRVYDGTSGLQIVDTGIYSEDVGGKRLLYVPWQWNLERDSEIEGDIVFGHFEVKELVSWSSEEQVSIKEFDQVGMVFSGHIHKVMHNFKNFLYVGVPFQRNFGDGIGGGVAVSTEYDEEGNIYWYLVNSYGVKLVNMNSVDDLIEYGGEKIYVRTTSKEVVDNLRIMNRADVVGVEYIPDAVSGYNESQFQNWENKLSQIDTWGMLEEYGKQVLKLNDKQVEWLKGVKSE